MTEEANLRDYVKELHSRLTVEQLGALLAENFEIEQILGRALGYPELYPAASDLDDGQVGVGDNVPITLALEAASLITKLRKELEDAKSQARSS